MTRTPAARKVPLKFVLLEIIVICAAISFFYLSWHSYQDQQKKLSWPITSMTITAWKVEPRSKWYQVFLLGSIHVASESYPIELRWEDADWDRENRVWVPKKDAPKTGEVLSVRYNPAHPSQVERKEVPSKKLTFLGLGVCLALMAVALHYSFLKAQVFRRNRHDRRRRGLQAKQKYQG